jgi:Flp pilus assembly protein TadD
MQRKAWEAVAAFEAAVRLEPESASACFHLAVALAEVGRFADARTAAERAIRLRPGDAAARALLQNLPRTR